MSEANLEELTDKLVDNYIHQKELALQRAGVKTPLNCERLARMVRPNLERMAQVIADWDVTPGMVIEAVFSYAASNRHFDGPLPSLLYSVKYLSKALAYYMGVPYEAVMEKRSLAVYLAEMDEMHSRFRKEIGTADITFATSFPVESRYLFAIERFDLISAAYLSPSLLERLAADRKVRRWMEHRGVRYEAVAEQFNKIKNKL